MVRSQIVIFILCITPGLKCHRESCTIELKEITRIMKREKNLVSNFDKLFLSIKICVKCLRD